jgi:hypothetical protein
MTAMFALTLALAAPPDDYNLMWKLKEGDTFYAQGKVTIEQTFTAMGRSADQSITSETVVRYRVKEVKSGTTVIEMTYLSNKTKAEGLPGADALNDKLKGVTLTVTLDAKMEVMKLEGYDKTIDVLSQGNDQAKAAIKGMLPEAVIKQVLNETFALVPGGVTKVGGTWKRKDTLPIAGLGEMSVANTSKLDSVTDGVANVSWDAKGTFKAGDGTLPGLPFKLTNADLKVGKLAGSYTFDLSAGRLKTSKTQMELSGSLTLSANGKELPMDLKQKLTQSATLTDKNPVKE